MKVFVSYSRLEEAAVLELVADLRRGGQDVWLDRDLRGGEVWWDAIVQQIRECDVFVLALSDRSWRSKPCRAELDYARSLGKQVLGVQVGRVQSLRAMSIGDRQVIDYRNRDAATALSLVAAVLAGAGGPKPRPDPLPDPPAIPFAYLLRLGRTMEATQMSSVEQAGVLAQLKQAWVDEYDEGARHDVENLMRELRSRPDATRHTVRDVDALLGAEARVVPGTAVPTSIGIAVGLWIPATFLALIGPLIAQSGLGLFLMYSALAGLLGVAVMQTGRSWGRVLAVVAATVMTVLLVAGMFAEATPYSVANSIPAALCYLLALVSVIGAVRSMFRPASSAFLRDRRR